nr:DUF4097 domain-containing protein [Neobacillus sp. Marseille-Q6967]
MKRIVILLLVITGLYIVFNQAFQLEGFAFAGSKDGSAQVTNHTDTIKIDVGGVSTTIIPEDRDDVKAVLTGKGNLIVKKDGNRVEVKTINKWFSGFSFSEKRKLKVYIPEDFNKEIEIHIDSGNLDFSGDSMELDRLSLNLGSGNVDLKDIKVNEFVHDGSSGNVEIDRLTTKSGTFDLSSGNVEIKDYTGKLKADVSSGRFNLEMEKLTDSVEIDVSSGIVNLDLPDNADFELDGEVSSGKVSSDFPLNSKEQEKDHIRGIHGSGKHKVDISVSSGNVSIH